jgi:hypothetical protein
MSYHARWTHVAPSSSSPCLETFCREAAKRRALDSPSGEEALPTGSSDFSHWQREAVGRGRLAARQQSRVPIFHANATAAEASASFCKCSARWLNGPEAWHISLVA